MSNPLPGQVAHHGVEVHPGHIRDGLGRFRALAGHRTRCVGRVWFEERQQVRVGQDSQELVELTADSVVVDPDAFEDRLVEQSTVRVRRVEVKAVAVLQKIERLGEGALGRSALNILRRKSLFDCFQLPGDTGLFSLEEIERQGVGVVSLKELAALVEKTLLLPGEASRLAGGFVSTGVEVRRDGPLDGDAIVVAELNPQVFVGDQILHLGDENRLALAVSGFLMSPDTDEVRVDGAMAVLRHGHDHSAGAGAAEDGAPQVVRVLAFLLAVPVTGEDLLDSRPGLAVDESVVPSVGVLGAPVRDDTLVVGVAEDFVQLRAANWLSRSLDCWDGRQPASFEFTCELE